MENNCHVCGYNVNPYAMRTCVNCNARQHLYCMRVYSPDTPLAWHCDVCQIPRNDAVVPMDAGGVHVAYTTPPAAYFSQVPPEPTFMETAEMPSDNEDEVVPEGKKAKRAMKDAAIGGSSRKKRNTQQVGELALVSSYPTPLNYSDPFEPFDGAPHVSAEVLDEAQQLEAAEERARAAENREQAAILQLEAAEERASAAEKRERDARAQQKAAEKRARAAEKGERTAKALQQAAEIRERAAEERLDEMVKELKEIAEVVKVLQQSEQSPSPPPS